MMGGQVAKEREGYEKFIPLDLEQYSEAVDSTDSAPLTAPLSLMNTSEGDKERESSGHKTAGVPHQDSTVSASDSGTGSMLRPEEAGTEGEDMVDGWEELDVLRDFFPRLIDAIVPEIEHLAIELYAKQLINVSTRDAVFDPYSGGNKMQKAFRILQCLERKVKGNDAALGKFIQVLQCCSQCIAGVGEEMQHTLVERSATNDSVFPPNGPPQSTHFHPPVRTQFSEPCAPRGFAERHQYYASFYQKKQASYPGAPGSEGPTARRSPGNTRVPTITEDTLQPCFIRTASTCSTGEEDLRKLADGLAGQLQRLSQRQEKRIGKVQRDLEVSLMEGEEIKKKNEELQKELKLTKHRNRQLNEDSLKYKKCRLELEKYKNRTADTTDQPVEPLVECQSCHDKDQLIERLSMEKRDHEAKIENLNAQIGILIAHMED